MISMSDDNSKEQLYKELLQEMRESLKVVRELMKSSNEGIRLEAVRSFKSLSEMAIDLAEFLDSMTNPNERDRNPLSRRSRIEN
jgi:uncharacterized protein YutE (UPF0331/DUF86 family)